MKACPYCGDTGRYFGAACTFCVEEETGAGATVDPLTRLLLRAKRKHFEAYLDEACDGAPCPLAFHEVSSKGCTCGAEEWNREINNVLPIVAAIREELFGSCSAQERNKVLDFFLDHESHDAGATTIEAADDLTCPGAPCDSTCTLCHGSGLYLRFPTYTKEGHYRRDVNVLEAPAELRTPAQPTPAPNTLPPIVDLVTSDLLTRKAHGVKIYGTPLQPHNGRDMLRDAYEEAMDLACYLRGMLYERDGK